MKQMTGVTILEILLVLAIMSAIVLLSVNQYQIYRKSVEIQRLKFNVDMLAESASHYYYANCRYNGSNTAKFDPQSPNYSSMAVVVNISSDLINSGYLTTVTAPINSIVNNTSGWNGYGVMFWEQQSAVYAPPPNSSTQIGTNEIWQMQIAVRLNDPSLAQEYLRLTEASCVTSGGINNFIAPCQFNGTFVSLCIYLRSPGIYDPSNPISYWFNLAANAMNCPYSIDASAYNNILMFARMPISPVTGNAPADLWLTTPTVQQFTQQYYTYSTSNLTNGNNQPEYQYFKCGS